MAYIISAPTKFDSLHLQVLNSIWEYTGDIQTTTLREPLGGDEPFMKSILTKGSCRMEYPGTDHPDVIAAAPNSPIFPAQNAIGKKYFKMTTLEDNMEAYCVQPYVGYRVRTVSDGNLNAGDSMPIAKGVLVLVFGDSYTVNGDAHSGFSSFAVQNNDIVVGANSNCRVIVFNSESV